MFFAGRVLAIDASPGKNELGSNQFLPQRNGLMLLEESPEGEL